MPHRILNLVLACFAIAILVPQSQAQSAASCSFHLFEIHSGTGLSNVSEGINQFGTTVGFSELANGGNNEGWTHFSNGQTNFFMAPNSSTTQFMRRNSNGVNVGSFTPKGSTVSRGLVTHSTSFQSVSFPGGLPTFLSGINKFNVIVGSYIGTDKHFDAVKLQSGHFTVIRVPNAQDTQASAINDNGVIVGTVFPIGANFSRGWILKSGVFHFVDFPNSRAFGGTTLNDISNTGEIVGSAFTGPDSSKAFMLVNGVIKTITVPHSRLTEANGINQFNVITGRAILVNPVTGNETETQFTATCH